MMVTEAMITALVAMAIATVLLGIVLLLYLWASNGPILLNNLLYFHPKE